MALFAEQCEVEDDFFGTVSSDNTLVRLVYRYSYNLKEYLYWLELDVIMQISLDGSGLEN